jgi:hypothetical protein
MVQARLRERSGWMRLLPESGYHGGNIFVKSLNATPEKFLMMCTRKS